MSYRFIPYFQINLQELDTATDMLKAKSFTTEVKPRQLECIQLECLKQSVFEFPRISEKDKIENKDPRIQRKNYICENNL